MFLGGSMGASQGWNILLHLAYEEQEAQEGELFHPRSPAAGAEGPEFIPGTG